MKKVLHHFTLLGLFAAVAAACNPRQELVANQAADNPCTLSQLPDSALLTLEEARHMVANYAPRAGYVERDGEQLANTRVAWISKAYLCAILQQINETLGDGMHIYFAAYDSVYNDVGQHVPPPQWWGYNTLVFTSTRDSVGADGQHYHRDYFGEEQAEAGAAKGSTGQFAAGRLAPINRVGLCPPPEQDCRRRGASLL